MITQLYPPPQKELPLEGLYLRHDLLRMAAGKETPLVYSNYVVSLDGRIAIPHPSGRGMMVPEQIANDRDWRLFQELAIQADVIITSGRYLRDYAEGRAQEILRVYDDPRFADLKDWRLSRGLSPQPDLAVISGSLNFPIPEVLQRGERVVWVFTTRAADADRVAALERQNARVVRAGETGVEGGELAAHLSAQGYRTIYNATGPKVLHLLLAGGVLKRIYLTHAHRILGGQPFSSIVEGDLLRPPVNLKLHRLYLDPLGLDGLGQLFVVYDVVAR